MGEEQSKTFVEWLDKNVSINKVLIGLATLLAGGGAGIGLEFNFLEDKIQEMVQPSIDKTAYSVVNDKVCSVLDSVLSTMGEGDHLKGLCKDLHLEKDTFSFYMRKYIKWQKNIKYIGLYTYKGKLKYRHIDGNIYIPIYNDSTDMYYFVDSRGISRWCN